MKMIVRVPVSSKIQLNCAYNLKIQLKTKLFPPFLSIVSVEHICFKKKLKEDEVNFHEW